MPSIVQVFATPIGRHETADGPPDDARHHNLRFKLIGRTVDACPRQRSASIHGLSRARFDSAATVVSRGLRRRLQGRPGNDFAIDQSKHSHLADARLTISQIDAGMLRLRRNEQDFMARKDEKNIARFAANYAVPQANVNRLERLLGTQGVDSAQVGLLRDVFET